MHQSSAEVGRYYGVGAQRSFFKMPRHRNRRRQYVESGGLRDSSVEVLAYIYEHTLVDKAVRKEMSIYSTPHSLARYIVHRLPFEEVVKMNVK
jgi:hypothetical protein